MLTYVTFLSLGTYVFLINEIVLVSSIILVPTPSANLPNSYANQVTHNYALCPGTWPDTNFLYEHTAPVSGCTIWLMYSGVLICRCKIIFCSTAAANKYYGELRVLYL